jgi:hypothetical protein
MNKDSRLLRFESVMHGRDLALLWLLTAQGKSGYRDHWKTRISSPGVSESEEAGLLYHLANDLNCAVIAEAHQWRSVAGWAALLGVARTCGQLSGNYEGTPLCHTVRVEHTIKHSVLKMALMGQHLNRNDCTYLVNCDPTVSGSARLRRTTLALPSRSPPMANCGY